jgi:hypothetical protein
VGAVGTELLICSRCFCKASCWECRRRYFCRAKARSGSFCIGFDEIDIPYLGSFTLLAVVVGWEIAL